MNQSAETSETTKNTLMLAAIKLFKEKDSSLVTVSDICKEAKVTRNSLYYHYGNKENLIDSIGDWIALTSKEDFFSVLKEPTYVKQFWKVYELYIEKELEVGAIIMGLVCISRIKKGTADYYSYLGDERSIMISLLDQARNSGQIGNPVDSETLVDMSYAIIRGFGLQWCFTNGETDFLGLAKAGMNALLLPMKGFEL